MSEVYQLEGNERVETSTHPIPCGDCIETSYFHATTHELVRKDVEIKVSEKFMREAGLSAKANLF